MVLKIALKPKHGSGQLAKKVGDEVDLEDNAVALTLFTEIERATGLKLDRIRLTVKNEQGPKDHVVQQNELLKDLSQNGRLTVYYRDLGPQVDWMTVFIIEYLGPIVIHLAFFNLREYIYGEEYLPTATQTIMYFCVVMHFFKREYETAYVHKFSVSTMPLFNLFKNSGHYWLLSGVLLAYFGYAPTSWWTGDAPAWKKFAFYTGGVIPQEYSLVLPVVWLFAEIGNFAVHQNLSSLRPKGTTERRIPYGFGFDTLSCPNYFFEFCAWATLTLMTGNWAMLLFTIVGTAQMYVWAVKKHRRYLKEFPDYPKNRKAMFPFLA